MLAVWNLLTLGAPFSQEGQETFYFASQSFIYIQTTRFSQSQKT